jgi:hypothetical protein
MGRQHDVPHDIRANDIRMEGDRRPNLHHLRRDWDSRRYRMDSSMNALELFRAGKDYIEISAILKIPVPEVERKIHALRSAEKGDTSQEEYIGRYLSRRDYQLEYQRRYYHTVGITKEKRGLVPYVGKEAR